MPALILRKLLSSIVAFIPVKGSLKDGMTNIAKNDRNSNILFISYSPEYRFLHRKTGYKNTAEAATPNESDLPFIGKISFSSQAEIFSSFNPLA
jgi:hypothetical protein